MQLRIARLCLDCDEVHEGPHCPVCASEAFAYLTRWVPAPERRMRPRPTTSPEAEAYRQITTKTAPVENDRAWWKRGAVGLTMLGLAGWAWQRSRTRELPDQRARINVDGVGVDTNSTDENPASSSQPR